ncbi:MAG: hypothetical protein ACE5Q6_26310, partial [Dehalococcoidia bacterium]
MARIRPSQQNPDLLAAILAKLERTTGPDSRGWHHALCPFHKDTDSSLGINGRGFKCLGCGEKGSLQQLAQKLGLSIPSSAARSRNQPQSGVALSQLAQAKALPVEHLRELGWHDVEHQSRPAVAIPYFDTAGNLLREQLRIRLDKRGKRDARFVWAPGHGTWPLGLDRLQSAREAGYILIVEGATDFAACLLGGIPVLAVPGANAFKSEWAVYLAGIPRICVWQENDAGGSALVKAVARSRSDLLVVTAPAEAKDPCELRQLDPEGFPQRMADLLATAAPLPTEDPSEAEPDALDPRGDFAPGMGTQASGSADDRAIEYVLKSGAALFHDQHGDAFIAFNNEQERREVWPLRSKAASNFIRWLFFRAEEKGLSGEALATARGTLSVMALFQGERRYLFLRVAETQEGLWYDLGDWRAVLITPKGWEVVEHAPILFRHYSHQMPQVEPQRGGSLDTVMSLFNVRDAEARLLLEVYLVAGLLSGIPLPVLLVHGEQGSAKTFLLKIIRSLLDPSSLATLAPPDNLREFVQQAAHHRTLYLDNLSYLSDWMSDALCRLCTGDGFSKRELYSDDDDIIYNLRGLGGITGINLVVSKPDLLDRALILRLA